MSKKLPLTAAMVIIFADSASAAPRVYVGFRGDNDFSVGPSLSTGAKIGVAFGTLAVLILMLVAWLQWKKRKLLRQQAASNAAAVATKARDLEQGLRVPPMAQYRPPSCASATNDAASVTSKTPLQVPAPAHLAQEKSQ
ncbi:hypothetical protein BGZ73_004311 [Actinomortierella ambigua]|nr:hypothetical protein BGZ73_004311 [Actinomortierella ambigua]